MGFIAYWGLRPGLSFLDRAARIWPQQHLAKRLKNSATRDRVGHGPKTGDLPSVWLDTCGCLPYQPDAWAKRVAASPSQGFAGLKASRGQRLRGVKPCSGLRKAGRRPRTGFAGPFKGAGPLFGHRDRSQGRRVGGHQDEPCFHCSRMRWIMPMSSLSSLDLAKARSTRRTRLLTLSGWLKPKIRPALVVWQRSDVGPAKRQRLCPSARFGAVKNSFDQHRSTEPLLPGLSPRPG